MMCLVLICLSIVRMRSFWKNYSRNRDQKSKISVFKSIIEAQQTQWTMKPLRLFTTRDAVQWIRGLRDTFAARSVHIGLDDLASSFFRNEITGKLLIAHDLEEKEIVGWIKNNDHDHDDGDAGDHEEDCYKAAEIIHAEVTKRKQKDEALKQINDEDKQYDFNSLER
eukprot:262377_1